MAAASQATSTPDSTSEEHVLKIEQTHLPSGHPDDVADKKKPDTHVLSSNDVESLYSQAWQDDPQNPMNWAPARRWTIIILLVVTNLIAAICSSAFEPALPSIMADFGVSNDSLATLTISIYVVGYCMGPLVVAPISELYGRAVVLYPAYVVFMVCLAVCGASRSLALFIVFRAFMGFAGIAFVLLGPALVADIIAKEKRGLVLSVMSFGPVVGPTLGPTIGGYIVENTSWRWIFWSTLLMFGATFLLALATVRETYGPVLIERKRTLAEKDSGSAGQRNTTQKDPRQLIKAAWTRPFKMLFLTPIVPLLGFYTAISNAYAQICFATLGTVFQNNYSFSPGQSGLAYFGLAAGFVFCQLSLGSFSDRHMLRMEVKHGDRKPEYRLPPMFIGAFLLPVGFFWYGWSLESHTHWIVPIVGSSLIAVGILYGYLPVQMYLVDTYTTYAASATGACTIIRSICSALLPLSANPLYDHLGYGWGNSLLAFIALGFVPIALLIWRFGERIRTNPRFQPRL